MVGAKLIAAAITLATLTVTQARPHILTYYGTESDGFLGKRPGASWHSRDCSPDKIDNTFLGTSAPYNIPYCSKLVVSYNGHNVQVVVVDRAAKDTIDEYSHLDLWPAAAEILGMKEAGKVIGLVIPYYKLPKRVNSNVW